MDAKKQTNKRTKKPDIELCGAGHISCYILYVMRFVNLNKFPNYNFT